MLSFCEKIFTAFGKRIKFSGLEVKLNQKCSENRPNVVRQNDVNGRMESIPFFVKDDKLDRGGLLSAINR